MLVLLQTAWRKKKAEKIVREIESGSFTGMDLIRMRLKSYEYQYKKDFKDIRKFIDELSSLKIPCLATKEDLTRFGQEIFPKTLSKIRDATVAMLEAAEKQEYSTAIMFQKQKREHERRMRIEFEQVWTRGATKKGF